MQATPTKLFLHGSAVMKDGIATLYLGKPKSGKTVAVLTAIEHGGQLVADDYVCIERVGDDICVYPPENGKGLIEIRSLGIARLPYASKAMLTHIVFLDNESSKRLPPWLKDCTISYSYPKLAA